MPGVLLAGRGASQKLARLDPTFAPLVDRFGPARVDAGRDVFASLVEAICHQQLSIYAGRAVYGRVEARAGDPPSPSKLLASTEAELRACGLSRPKVGFVHDLARRAEAGDLPLAKLSSLTDEEIVDTLTQVKGIGVWTAQMLLIFTLHRPDVLPTKDLGILDGARIVFGRRSRPTELGLTRLGERWRPYRSVACWYLWRERDRVVRKSGMRSASGTTKSRKHEPTRTGRTVS